MVSAQRFTIAVVAVALVFAGAIGAMLLADRDGSSPTRTAQAQERMQDRGISVQGEGRISVTPDVGRVTLGVEVEGSDLESLRGDADSRMNDVIDALQELGIDEADIQTVVYDIRVQDDRVEPMPSRDEPVTDEAPATEDEVDDAEATDDDEMTVEDEEDEVEPETGTQMYTILQLVQVRVTDIELVGDVIDTALDAGANRVANIFFEVEDRQAAIEQAREMAVEEALGKAEHLADLTGVTLGVPLRIDESSPSGPSRAFEEVAMDEEVAEDAGMARIEPGEQEIWVTVYITYDIE